MDVCEILNEVYISILVGNKNSFKNTENDEKIIREKLSFIPSLIERLVKAGMGREAIIFMVKETILSSMEASPDKVQIRYEEVKHYSISDIANLYPGTIRDRTDEVIGIYDNVCVGIFNAKYAEIFKEVVNECLTEYCKNDDIDRHYHLWKLVQESSDVGNTYSLMRIRCLSKMCNDEETQLYLSDGMKDKNKTIIDFIQDYNIKTKLKQEILSLIKIIDRNDKSRNNAKNDSRKGA